MISVEIKLDLPDQLARDARAAGLLTPRSLARLLKDGLARQAAAELREGAQRALDNGGKPMTMRALQAEVAAVRNRSQTGTRKHP